MTTNDLLAELEHMKPVMRKVINHILDNFADDINLDDLAMAAGISKFNLCRKFQKRYGVSPMRWLWIFRATVAAEFIKSAPSWSLTDVAFNCGFGSSAHFSRTFVAVHGQSPSQFRQGVIVENKKKCKRTPLSEFSKLYDNAHAVTAAFRVMIGEFSLQPNSAV